ncbi:MAG: flavin reductase family protein [Candidatus Bipolaricaulis sp.]|nr:flavin reductase family protein [Candidatus Bipolaricaulis sp.]MDD5646050.1 flavin reductase family protein [Candidatus Bipolaricaulis sp.]
MRRIEWNERAGLLRDGLSSGGAFLVALDESGRANPMTIGWAQVGIVWSRPILTVYVRKSRYTHRCLQQADSFTVSVPRSGALDQALALCGSKSGRDLDKMQAAGLTPIQGRSVSTPVIDGCVLYYECRIVGRTQQELPDLAARDVIERYYPKGDPHLAVYGEILSAYVADRA